MGGCNCLRTEEETIFNEFWYSLPIRGLKAEDYFNIISPYFNKDNNLEFLNKDNIGFKSKFINIFLMYSPNLSISEQLFSSIFKCLKEDSIYLLYSLVFLTNSNGIEAKNVFIKLIMLGSPQLLVHDLIKKQNLIKILDLYIYLISEYCVSFLSVLHNNEEKFKLHFEGVFSREVRKKFIESEFFDNEKSGNTVNIEYFFKINLEKLNDDVFIRENLLLIRNNMMETPKIK